MLLLFLCFSFCITTIRSSSYSIISNTKEITLFLLKDISSCPLAGLRSRAHSLKTLKETHKMVLTTAVSFITLNVTGVVQQVACMTCIQPHHAKPSCSDLDAFSLSQYNLIDIIFEKCNISTTRKIPYNKLATLAYSLPGQTILRKGC